MKKPFTTHFALSAITLALIGCGSDSGDSTSGDNSGSASQGLLSMSLVDAPVDSAANVNINVSGVTLRSPAGADIVFQFCADSDDSDTGETDDSGSDGGSGSTGESTDESGSTGDDATAGRSRLAAETDTGDTTDDSSGDDDTTDDETGDTEESSDDDVLVDSTTCETPEIRTVDLLTLTGGNSLPLLDDQSVPAGDYAWIRLALDDDNPGEIVLDDGTVHALKIPSGAQTGLKINGGLSVTAGTENHVVIDFDLRKSVHKAGNKYLLRPTLKLVRLDDDSDDNSLSGSWLVENVPADCAGPFAYVYTADSDEPFDDHGSGNREPAASVEMTMNESGTGYMWMISYLEAGDYDIVYTCDGLADSPDTDDDIDLSNVQTDADGEVS